MSQPQNPSQRNAAGSPLQLVRVGACLPALAQLSPSVLAVALGGPHGWALSYGPTGKAEYFVMPKFSRGLASFQGALYRTKSKASESEKENR